jgi:hypothetical protein
VYVRGRMCRSDVEWVLSQGREDAKEGLGIYNVHCSTIL